MSFSQLFRPVYGEHFEVRPKHWWSRKQRGAARITAAILDAKHEPLKEEMRRVLHGHGDLWLRPSWTPTLRPDESSVWKSSDE